MKRSVTLVLGSMAALFAACEETSLQPAGSTPDAAVADASHDAGPARPEDAAPNADGHDAHEVADAARPPFDGSAPAVRCATEPCPIQITAGRSHYCALWSDAHVSCWGEPSRLGAPIPADSPSFGTSPVDVPGLGPVRELASGGGDTCVVTSSGSVSCWSENVAPTEVTEVAGASRVLVGKDGTSRCALVGVGGLRCWGSNPSLVPPESALDIGPREVASAALGTSAGLLVDTEGDVLSWGSDPLLLGRPASDIVFPPRPIPTLSGVFSLEVGDNSACAIDRDGRSFCWGQGSEGVLALGVIRSTTSPTEIYFPAGEHPRAFALAERHGCATTVTGTVLCWGARNGRGELGRAELPGVYVPTRVELGELDAVQVATGLESTCVLAHNGAVRCWGDNHWGQLGRGSKDGLRHPESAAVIGME